MTHTTTQELEALLPVWEQVLSTRSPKTAEAYLPAVRGFLAVLPDGHPTMAAVAGWVGSLNGAPATNAQRISAVRSFFRFAREAGVLEAIPEYALRRPHVEITSANRYLSVEELRSLVAAAASLSDRHLAAALGLATTGLRVSELARADWRDLYRDPEGRLGLLVRYGKGGKTRTVPVRHDLLAVLARLHGSAELDASDRSPLLPTRPDKRSRGGHYHYRALERLVTDAVARAELNGKRATCHWLRHSAFTHAAAAGASAWEIQTAAGHADISTSARYVHVARGLADSALNRLPELA